MKIHIIKILAIALFILLPNFFLEDLFAQCRGNFYDSGPTSSGNGSRLLGPIEDQSELLKQTASLSMFGKVVRNSFIWQLKVAFSEMFYLKLVLVVFLLFSIFFMVFFNFKESNVLMLPLLFCLFYISLVALYDLKGVFVFSNLEVAILLLLISLGLVIRVKTISFKIIVSVFWNLGLMVGSSFILYKFVGGMTFKDDPAMFSALFGDIISIQLINASSINSDIIAQVAAYITSLLIFLKISRLSMERGTSIQGIDSSNSNKSNIVLSILWLIAVLFFKQGGVYFSFFIFGIIISKNELLAEKDSPNPKPVLISILLIVSTIFLMKKLMYFDQTFLKMFSITLLVIALSVLNLIIINIIFCRLAKKFLKKEVNLYDLLIMIPHISISSILLVRKLDVSNYDCQIVRASWTIILMFMLTCGVLTYFS